MSNWRTRATASLVATVVVAGLLLNGAAANAAQALLMALLATACGLLALTPKSAMDDKADPLALSVPLLVPVGLAVFTLPVVPTSLSTVASEASRWLFCAIGVAVFALIRPQRESETDVWVVGAIALWVALVITHRAIEPDLPFGVLTVRTSNYQGWAPLINPNFNATPLLLALPLAARPLLRWRTSRPDRKVMAGAAIVASVAALAFIGAVGPWVALVGGVVFFCARGFVHPSRRVAAFITGTVAVLVAALVAWVELRAPTDSSASLRVDQWNRSIVLFLDHWVLGTGVGGYREAYTAIQNPFRFARFDHAHSDPLEGVIELGALGALAVCAVAFWSWRTKRRDPWSRASLVEVGLVATLIHACVDFPLQLPGIALLVALAIAWRVAVYETARTARPLPPKAVTGTLAVLGLIGASWLAYEGWLDHRVQMLRTSHTTSEDTGALLRQAPWRADLCALHVRLAARESPEAGLRAAQEGASRFPSDPEVLLAAGTAAVVAREPDQAKAWLTQAAARHAADPRPRALLSRLAEARGDHDEALAYWAEAIQRWPYPSIVHDRPYDRAFALMPVGLYWLDVASNGPMPVVPMQLGRKLQEVGDYATAVLAYEQAGWGREDYRHYPEVGWTLFLAGQTEEALDRLLQATVFDTTGLAWRYRALVLDHTGRDEEAQVDALRACIAAPSNIDHATTLLDLAQRRGGLPALIDAAERLPRGAARSSPQITTRVAQAAADTQRWRVCLDWLRAATTPAPTELLSLCEASCTYCP